MTSLTITVFNSTTTTETGNSYPFDRGQSVFKNFLLNHIPIQSKCGGKAICGYCRVKIVSGQKHCNKPLIEEYNKLGKEQIAQGWRLSCQVYCLKDIQVYIPSYEEVKTIINQD